MQELCSGYARKASWQMMQVTRQRWGSSNSEGSASSMRPSGACWPPSSWTRQPASLSLVRLRALNAEVQRYLVYLKYWILNLRPRNGPP